MSFKPTSSEERRELCAARRAKNAATLPCVCGHELRQVGEDVPQIVRADRPDSVERHQEIVRRACR
jgi:hypothetical protein